MSKTVPVEKDDDGIRVDRWFKRHYPMLTHGVLEKLLRKGEVRVDGKRAKSGDRLSTGQALRLPPQLGGNPERSTDSQASHPQVSKQARKEAEALVIHTDSSVLVLDKPPGLATQGGSGITKHVDGMLDLLAFGKKQRPRLVHRLDRDTSGVLIVARTIPAAASLAKALAERDASKIYWALVRGVPEKPRGTIKLALAKQGGRGDERMVGVDVHDKDAKYAVTDYVVVDKVGAEYAWIAAKPVTGRTHQIRVHLASLGTPIVGDYKYGGLDARAQNGIANQLHLHARSIDIAHPDGGRLQVTAPLPPHMLQTWKFLGFVEADGREPFGQRRR
ncbi:MAG TPA: RluA family pseudouridine synthase [Rhizomicrobium sp.]|jgi:23S rRNA pseudouridine955/2504/2580 synthase